MSFVLLGVRFPPKPPSATRAGPTHVVVQIYRGTGQIAEGFVWAGCENGEEYVLNVLPHTHTATFSESGLPSHTSWSVTPAPSSGLSTIRSSTTGTIKFSEPNGSYTYTITRIPGYQMADRVVHGFGDGERGEPANCERSLDDSRSTVKFTENGLVAGTSWQVTIERKGEIKHGEFDLLDLTQRNPLVHDHGDGIHSTVEPSSPLTVNGAKVNVKVTFT